MKKTLALLGVRENSKMPNALKPVIAQLAYANSDFAFQGDHLFQGNFYGVSIYDIADNQVTGRLVGTGGAELAGWRLCRRCNV